ncbi:hypothetical protein [Enterobacter soli]|uniref:hypothetical protein n=1 Tax=Enterobacter soli TaxID=885040 RepID=UPI003F848169
MANDVTFKVIEELFYKVDALNSIVQQLRVVLTPEQQEEFEKNTIHAWQETENRVEGDIKETVLKTKAFAYKYSGIKSE